MSHKEGQIAKRILALQNEDGTWGNEFHSLAAPTAKKPLTTEQALRRLKILGFTIEDEAIRKAVDCMVSCLRGERKIDNYWEKNRDWNLYTKLMLSTWVKIYEPDNEVALNFARQWANIMERAFQSGVYDNEQFQTAYQEEFYQGKNYQREKGVKEIGFVSFYPINLLQGLLTKETESHMLDYVIHYSTGIYYIYGKPLNQLPEVFQSIDTSRYLAAIDILSGYEQARGKLDFAVEWLEKNMGETGGWDLGPKARDNIYFPLSDSWRTVEIRKADYTEKILSIMQRIKQ